MTTTQEPAGRWHTVPFDPDSDPQPPVDDAEDDAGEGLDGVLVADDPIDEAALLAEIDDQEAEDDGS